MNDIYIFGAGPTGLSLAWLLKKETNKNIFVIEKYKSAGGTWTTRWTDDNLFTQHSPQVLSNSYVNTINLWKDMGIDYKDFTGPTHSEWKTLIWEHMNFTDKMKLVFGYMKYMFNQKHYNHVTVKDYFRRSLSNDGWQVVKRLCYILDGVPPSIMTIGEFYGSFDQNFNATILEMTKSSDNGFAKLWVDKLKEHGVKFLFNTSLEKLSYENEVVAYAKNNDSDDISLLRGEILLALDPLSLLKVLDVSDENIKNNWGRWDHISNKISKGIYTSLPIQFHFEQGIDVKEISCFGSEWNITCVIIPLTASSMQTISCSIMDMNAYSSFLNKHVYECNPEEVKKEVWRQVYLKNPRLPENPITTIGADVTWDESSGWSYDISSACRTILGPLKAYGEINGLAIVGPLNYRVYKPTTMESAVETALRFTGHEVETPTTLSFILKIILAIIIIVMLFVLIIK